MEKSKIWWSIHCVWYFSVSPFSWADEFQCDILFSFEGFLKDSYLKWNHYAAGTFVGLKRGTDIDQFNIKI
ncbi:MAG: hypothetical protein MI975_28715 [Cytophagales bacterium]|nr:hypothetical protein [Cytophagales bacterium]